ncbi:MAG: hypothetical protein V1913_07360 [Fibrobacterota bacterium]
MINQNAGKKALIPIGTSKPAPSAPVSEKAQKIITHVEDTVRAADFSSPAPATGSATFRERRKSSSKPAATQRIMKGFRLDADVCKALDNIKRTHGQVAAVFVNNLLRKELDL